MLAPGPSHSIPLPHPSPFALSLQAYELFLKNMVGGLHTVYTKLKRLDIVPRICNVEQGWCYLFMGLIWL